MQEIKRTAIIGPIIIDQKSSGGEGEKLYQNLLKEGHTVFKKSGYRNKLLRLIDTLYFMWSKRNEYDQIVALIFSGRAFVLEFLVFVLAKFLNKRIIGVLHGGALADFYTKFPTMVERLYNQCESLHTPSKFLQHYFLARGWDVGYLPNFVQLDNFPYTWKQQTNSNILWVRAFHDIYNPELAINAIAELKKEIPNIRLTMVGPDMGMLVTCKSLIKQLQLEDNITIVGFVPNSELLKYYQTHTIFITTTRFESFGVALMEAASVGIPMVSVAVGEIPLLWEKEKEMILCDADPKQFAAQIKRVLLNTQLQENLSENAHQKAQSYTWKKIYPIWKTILS